MVDIPNDPAKQNVPKGISAKQPRPEFELVSPSQFPTTIPVTPRTPP